MNTNHKISIIIPAYNSESTLSSAVKSALNQTYKNFEIIIVNDGSSDKTQNVIDFFCKKDSRIISFSHPSNKGVSAARNTALRASSGDYILFLDSDDTLLPYALEYSLKAALHFNADYVDSYHLVRLSGIKSFRKSFTEFPLPDKTRSFGSVADSPEIIDKYYYIKGKLFERSLIQDIFFDETLPVYEDLLYDLTLKSKLRNYVLLEKPIYYYFENINSSVNSKGSQHLFYLKAIEKLIPIYSDKPDEVQKRVHSLLYKNALFAFFFKLYPQKNKTLHKAFVKLNSLLPSNTKASRSLSILHSFTKICIKKDFVLSFVLLITSRLNIVRLYFCCLYFLFPYKTKIANERKIKINMLSMADTVEGQGVGSAYKELVSLLQNYGKNDFLININKSVHNSDILHIHTVEPRNLLLMKLSRKPVIVYVHFLPDTLDGSIKLPKPIFDLFKKYVIYFYKSADKLVVVNPSLFEKIESIGIKKDKIEYIPNFVSKKKFYEMSDARKASVRSVLNKKYGIPKESFLVLGCGQVQTRKGITDFIETARLLPNVQFIWVGGFSFGKITDGYKDLAPLMKYPPKNVTFTGIVPRSKMLYYYNASDLLFVPSFDELFPMTILEAANIGMPILLRDLDLYKPILFNYYLAANNNTEFAKQIRKLSKKDDFYDKACISSLRIADFYSEEKIYEKWKNLYFSFCKK